MVKSTICNDFKNFKWIHFNFSTATYLMAMIMLWLLYIHTHNTYTHVSVHIAALSDVLFVLVLVAPLLPALERLHTWKAAPLYALLLQHSFQFSRAFAYFVVIVVVFSMSKHKTARPHAPLVLRHLHAMPHSAPLS